MLIIASFTYSLFRIGSKNCIKVADCNVIDAAIPALQKRYGDNYVVAINRIDKIQRNAPKEPKKQETKQETDSAKKNSKHNYVKE